MAQVICAMVMRLRISAFSSEVLLRYVSPAGCFAAASLYRLGLTSTATWAHFRLSGECLADDASRSIALVTLPAAAWLSQAVCVERFLSVFLVRPQLPLTQRYDNERIANCSFGSHGDSSPHEARHAAPSALGEPLAAHQLGLVVFETRAAPWQLGLVAFRPVPCGAAST